VFIISGLLKLVDSSFTQNFAMMGMPLPEISVYAVGLLEFGCGMLILGRLYLRLAAVILFFIMIGAILVASLPMVFTEGILTFLFEIRLNVILMILLTFIFYSGQPQNTASS
jgi:uncharacterized membrane protein YphA (DoxX/SURF4 family)